MTSVVVAGGGHNGLVCAAYLARAGIDVTVLEAGPRVGGTAATVPGPGGAPVNLCNCDHSFVLASPLLEELDLASYGLRYLPAEPATIFLGWDERRPPIALFADADRTLDALAATVPEDVGAYRAYLDAARPAADLLFALSEAPLTPGRVARQVLERHGRGVRALTAWTRRSAAEVVDSLFSSEALRAAVVAGGPAVWGVSPTEAGTGVGALAFALRHHSGVGRPVGGSGALPRALAACIGAHGGTIRTRAAVEAILLEGDVVRGVRLAGGEEVPADVVVGAVDPRHVLCSWLRSPPAAARPSVRRLRRRPARDGYESKLDAVIQRRPQYRALGSEVAARLGIEDPLVPTTVITPTLAGIDEALAAAAAGQVAARPIAYVNLPSVLDPTMRAPDGGDVFSLEVLYTPYALVGGWDGSREPERWLAAYAGVVEEGFLDAVGPWRVTTPPRYEADHHLVRGLAPAFAGTPLALLAARRDRALTRYETPVRGLYLTGAGTWPGAGVWGASGRNTAAVVLRRLPR